MIGTGPEGLTCAHYLAQLGYRIDLFDETGQVGERLKEFVKSGSLPRDAYDRELAGIIRPSISFHGKWKLASETQLEQLRSKYDGVFLTTPLESLKTKGAFAKNMPTVFVGGSTAKDAGHPREVVDAVRDGRQAAVALHTLIANQKKR